MGYGNLASTIAANYGLEIQNLSPDLFGDGRSVAFAVDDETLSILEIEFFIDRIPEGYLVRAIDNYLYCHMRNVVSNLDAAILDIVDFCKSAKEAHANQRTTD